MPAASGKTQRSAQVGAYYKARTREHFRDAYQVVDLELVRWVGHQSGRPVPVKRDQLGADLLLINAQEAILVQVKGGRTWRSGLAKARRELQKYAVPPWVQRWIVGWPYRARRPVIEEVDC